MTEKWRFISPDLFYILFTLYWTTNNKQQKDTAVTMKRIRLNHNQKQNKKDATTSATTGSSSSSSSVILFQNAIHQYVDENKPDPIQLKQIQSWKMEWMDDDDDDKGGWERFL